MATRLPVTIAYLGLKELDKDKINILRFAQEKKFAKPFFVDESGIIKENWRERKIKPVIDSMKASDRVIVPELKRLGRSTTEVLDILKQIMDKGIDVYSVKEDFRLDNAVHKEAMSPLFDLFSGLEKGFASIRAKEAQNSGMKGKIKKAGRPKGPGKSKLDKYRKEIINLLKNGSTKAYVAKRYETTLPNLYNWLKKNNIDARPIT